MNVFFVSDWTSIQVQKNGLAQATVQTAPQGSGGMF